MPPTGLESAILGGRRVIHYATEAGADNTMVSPRQPKIFYFSNLQFIGSFASSASILIQISI